MATGQAAIDIKGSADEVWAVVGDFGGIGGWMPGMDSCRVVGEDRILETMGMTITERLVSKDDGGRALTYAIVDGAPVESHQAVITVSPSGATQPRDVGRRGEAGRDGRPDGDDLPAGPRSAEDPHRGMSGPTPRSGSATAGFGRSRPRPGPRRRSRWCGR